jgi:methylthioribulose-1-phosphate dehydratase
MSDTDLLGIEHRWPERAKWPALQGLAAAGEDFYRRGWSLGTSSNYSVVLSKTPTRVLLTASGKDKGHLGSDDFVLVDEAGKVLRSEGGKPSAEMWLHLILAQRENIGAILHTHSPSATLLSDLCASDGGFWIEGYEMLKGLSGITTHEAKVWVPIFPNTQDIPSLANAVEARLNTTTEPKMYGYLIRNHGLYTWGKDLAEARRHIEVFEFLFDVLLRKRALK